MASVASRLREALEASGIGVNGLDRALGKKPGYTSTLLKRENEPTATNLYQMSLLLGVRLVWLITGEGAMRDEGTPQPPSAEVATRRTSFGQAPGWAEAEREARQRYEHVPEYAWEGARQTSGPKVPEHVSPESVLAFARAWEMAATPAGLVPERPPSRPGTSFRRAS